MGAQPVICLGCGQRGDEKPGFSRQAFPEAVGNEDGMVPVDSFKCNSCGRGFVVPVGTIEVRTA